MTEVTEVTEVVAVTVDPKFEALMEIKTALVAELEAFIVDSAKEIKGNKAAGRRARISLGEIKKMVTPYRRESVLATK